MAVERGWDHWYIIARMGDAGSIVSEDFRNELVRRWNAFEPGGEVEQMREALGKAFEAMQALQAYIPTPNALMREETSSAILEVRKLLVDAVITNDQTERLKLIGDAIEATGDDSP